MRVSAWVLYDLANTVYAATLTFLFTPYCEQNFGGLTSLGVTQTWSMVLAGFSVPLLGVIIDRTRRTGLYLSIATILCVAAMAGWGISQDKAWMLFCFFIANFTYNIGLLFYNSLLPSVASGQRSGLVSGIGTGVGYFGTILVLIVLLGIEPKSRQFELAAAMFLIGALPCLLLVGDRRPKPPASSSKVGYGVAMRGAMTSLLTTLRELPRHRALLFFLLANFCLVDVLNTAVLFFGSFTKNVFEQAAQQNTLVFLGHTYSGEQGLQDFFRLAGLCLNALALLFGIGLGTLTDRFPLRVMQASGIALLFALIGGAYFGGNSPLGFMLTLVLLGSFGLSGIWTAGRKIVVLLAPQERIGEYFGLYGITVKLSVIGSTIYAVVKDSAGTKPAMLAQSAQLLLGLVFLSLVRLPKHRQANAK